MEAVATGDEVAAQFLTLRLMQVGDARSRSVEIVKFDVGDLEVQRSAALGASLDEVFDDLLLAVDRDVSPVSSVIGMWRVCPSRRR